MGAGRQESGREGRWLQALSAARKVVGKRQGRDVVRCRSSSLLFCSLLGSPGFLGPFFCMPTRNGQQLATTYVVSKSVKHADRELLVARSARAHEAVWIYEVSWLRWTTWWRSVQRHHSWVGTGVRGTRMLHTLSRFLSYDQMNRYITWSINFVHFLTHISHQLNRRKTITNI